MNELKSVTYKKEITCPECGGIGFIWDRSLSNQEACSNCNGSGTIEKDVTFELKGVIEGEKFIKFPECDKYIIGNKGTVISLKNGRHRVLMPVIRAGYESYDFCFNGGKKRVNIHRLIYSLFNRLPLQGEYVVDHIDRNKNNNDISNLRASTIQLNRMNSGRSRAGYSKYKGVSYEKDRSKWVAHICKDGKNTKIGRYETEEEAAKVYDSYAKEYFGKYAYLNFPNWRPE